MAQGNFHACHAVTAAWEGSWSDHDRDPGGATMYGITIGTLSKWRGRQVTKAEVKALTRSEAEQIYKAWYWDAVKADHLPAGVDLVIYDFAVNSGPGRAAKTLQKAVGVKQDGAIGPVTLAAVAKADHRTLINLVCDGRMAFLRGLKTWGTFGRGWSNRVTDVRKQAQAMVGVRAKPVPAKPADTPATGLLTALFQFLANLFRRSA